jgi:hypothetical protein
MRWLHRRIRGGDAGAAAGGHREEFFDRPNYWYYLGGAPIPDEWIAEAWEQLPEFRENVTCEFVREASKGGDLYCARSSLEFLAGILPMTRMVEMYERVRARSPQRESEFRPTFEEVFGERMAAFPAPAIRGAAVPVWRPRLRHGRRRPVLSNQSRPNEEIT